MLRVVRAVTVAGLMLAPALSTVGCAPLVIGGAAAGAAAVANDQRGVGGFVSDLEIQAEINRLWLVNSIDPTNVLDITVDSGRVLLLGRTTRAQQRLDAERMTWQVNGVKEVINEIQVDNTGSSLVDSAKDTWISTQVRARLTVENGVSSQNYSIDTVGGVVYLLGTAKSQGELNTVLQLTRSIGGVQRVVSHVRAPGGDTAPTSFTRP